jgi:RimJ/RimL family protein N-acetyltransferase
LTNENAPAREHVTLRRASPADTDLVLAWRAEPRARRYQPLRQLSADALRERLTARAASPLDPSCATDVQWIVETTEGPVGWMTVEVTSREHGIGTLGYTIGEWFRRRGLATAAVRAVFPLVFAPTMLDLYRLEAVAAVANTASRHVLERTGLRYEGIARAYLVIDGVRVDHARYALLRPEWERTGGNTTDRDAGV